MLSVLTIHSANESQHLVSYRETLFGILSRNRHLRDALHVSARDARLHEVQSVICNSSFSRKHDLIQQSLSEATYLSSIVSVCQTLGLRIDAPAQYEAASILWKQGEIAISVKMLQELCARTDLEDQSIAVGRAGMLAQLVSRAVFSLSWSFTYRLSGSSSCHRSLGTA